MLAKQFPGEGSSSGSRNDRKVKMWGTGRGMEGIRRWCVPGPRENALLVLAVP